MNFRALIPAKESASLDEFIALARKYGVREITTSCTVRVRNKARTKTVGLLEDFSYVLTLKSSGSGRHIKYSRTVVSRSAGSERGLADLNERNEANRQLHLAMAEALEQVEALLPSVKITILSSNGNVMSRPEWAGIIKRLGPPNP